MHHTQSPDTILSDKVCSARPLAGSSSVAPVLDADTSLLDSCNCSTITSNSLGDLRFQSFDFTSHFLSNQQYSITAVTTSTGSVAERYAYTAYGQPTFLDASGTPLTTQTSTLNARYLYTGREWDATLGLYHFRARWMSGVAGRFLGRDPIGYSGGISLVMMLSSRPVSLVDPTGYESWIPLPYVPGVGPLNPLTGQPVKPSTPPTAPPVIPPTGPFTVDHNLRKTKRCIFVLKPHIVSDVGADGIDRNGGDLVQDVVDGWVIPAKIRETGCCEILVVGHQGARHGIFGGATPEDDNHKIINGPIFPNFELSREIRKSLVDVGCKDCNLFMYTCGGGDPVIRDRNRQDLADWTGCNVAGTHELIYLGPPTKTPDNAPTCNMNPDRWGQTRLDGTCPLKPVPFFPYPTKIPLDRSPKDWSGNPGPLYPDKFR